MGTLSANKCNLISLRRCKPKVLLPSILIVGIFLSLYPHSGSAHLNLGKQCGELTCQDHEYCRDFDHVCKPCSVICKEGSNNFSKDTCESGCQDYLHDERYIRLQNNLEDGQDLGSLYKNIQKDILVLKILVGVCLVVIALILAAFIAFVAYFWRYIYPTRAKSNAAGDAKNKSVSDKDVKKKGMDLPVIYDNKYGLRNSPETPRRRGQPLNDDGHRSPSKVWETETMNSLNSAKTNGGVTMSTLVNSSNSASPPNGINNNRFRREPSESTIPDGVAYDSASLSAAQGLGPIYTHHV